MKTQTQLTVTYLIIAAILTFLPPVHADSAGKGGKKTPPAHQLELTHVSDKGITSFASQPKITPNHYCHLTNPGDGSVHAVRFMDNGKIRVYLGNENLNQGPPQVAIHDENDAKISVIPGTTDPITIIAKYTWAYDNRGMLTIYSGEPGQGKPVYQYNFVTSSSTDPDYIMYMGHYTPNPAAGPASLSARIATFGD